MANCAASRPGSVSIDALVERVLGEYREMPGLTLTLEQACRFWGCDATTFRRIADVLVERHQLRWSPEHHLMRADLELRARWRGREERTS